MPLVRTRTTAKFSYSETVPGLSCDSILVGALTVGVPGSVRDDIIASQGIPDFSFSCGTYLITSSSVAQGCSYREDCMWEIPPGHSMSYIASIASQALSSVIADRPSQRGGWSLA